MKHIEETCGSCGYSTIDLPDPGCCPECGCDPTVLIDKEERWAVVLNRFGISVAIGTLITQFVIKVFGYDWITIYLLGETKAFYNKGYSGIISLLDQSTLEVSVVLFFAVLLLSARNVRVNRTILLLVFILSIAAFSHPTSIISY